MSRYTGSSYKQARRVGFSISETGKELARHPYGPGQHGNDHKGKLSDYGNQLKEKQKVRFMYGVSERQFLKTFKEAEKMKGIHGTNFLRLLESRLDNLVYRLGFSNTRRGARQLVNHGHVTVNGKKVDIPSFNVSVGDEIKLREKSQKNVMFKENFESNILNVLPYLSKNEANFSGVLERLPERSEVPIEINEVLVVEYYSKN